MKFFQWYEASINTSTHVDENLNLNRKINDFGLFGLMHTNEKRSEEEEAAIDFESVELCKTILNWIFLLAE